MLFRYRIALVFATMVPIFFTLEMIGLCIDLFLKLSEFISPGSTKQRMGFIDISLLFTITYSMILAFYYSSLNIVQFIFSRIFNITRKQFFIFIYKSKYPKEWIKSSTEPIKDNKTILINILLGVGTFAIYILMFMRILNFI